MLLKIGILVNFIMSGLSRFILKVFFQLTATSQLKFCIVFVRKLSVYLWNEMELEKINIDVLIENAK